MTLRGAPRGRIDLSSWHMLEGNGSPFSLRVEGRIRVFWYDRRLFSTPKALQHLDFCLSRLVTADEAFRATAKCRLSIRDHANASYSDPRTDPTSGISGILLATVEVPRDFVTMPFA